MSLNICQKKKCITCCQKTEMILTKEDIKRIEKNGFKKEDFSIKNNEYINLKNINNKCFFHDGKKCIIYPIRPVGCKLYPIIYDVETQSAIIDKECPYHDYFSISQDKRMLLHETIDIIKKECDIDLK